MSKNSESQARAQLECIKEMVAALTLEGAAVAYVEDLSDVQVNTKLLRHTDATAADVRELSMEERRELLAERIEDGCEPPDFEFDEDEAQQRIQEDPLSVEVRSDWHPPGMEPDSGGEYRICLCTGGPAVQIVGELNSYREPANTELQHQDWFELWERLPVDSNEEEILLAYARQFWYGE